MDYEQNGLGFRKACQREEENLDASTTRDSSKSNENCSNPEMEQWRPVVGREGQYEVSDNGKVRRLSNVKRWRTSYKSEFPRKLRLKSNGYVYCHISGSPRITRYVHRMVAQAFIPNPLMLKEVNHIDGIKTNNAVSNLEWVAHRNNIQHAHAHGLMRPPQGQKHFRAKLNDSNVREIWNLFHIHGVNWRVLGPQFGVSPSAAFCIVTGRTWRHLRLWNETNRRTGKPQMTLEDAQQLYGQ